MSAASSLSCERLAVHVAEELSLNPGDFVRNARLAEDLGLDSFDMVPVLMWIEELGVRLPDEGGHGDPDCGRALRPVLDGGEPGGAGHA